MNVGGLRRSEEEQLERARAGIDLPAADAVVLLERLRRTRLAPVHAQAQAFDEVCDGFVVALHIKDAACERADAAAARARSAERELALLRVEAQELRSELQAVKWPDPYSP